MLIYLLDRFSFDWLDGNNRPLLGPGFETRQPAKYFRIRAKGGLLVHRGAEELFEGPSGAGHLVSFDHNRLSKGQKIRFEVLHRLDAVRDGTTASYNKICSLSAL